MENIALCDIFITRQKETECGVFTIKSRMKTFYCNTITERQNVNSRKCQFEFHEFFQHGPIITSKIIGHDFLELFQYIIMSRGNETEAARARVRERPDPIRYGKSDTTG